MGAPRYLQECRCGHTEAPGRFCSRCLRITESNDIRRHRASKELRRDPGVPEVAGTGDSRPHALSGTLLEAA
jgi:hypothetical protein